MQYPASKEEDKSGRCHAELIVAGLAKLEKRGLDTDAAEDLIAWEDYEVKKRK